MTACCRRARLKPADIEHVPLRGRSFDDGYTDLGSVGTLSVAGGGRRLTVRLDEGYPYAQVYAPPGERFVALEPMTGPANALTSGTRLRLVEPGGTFTARFTMTVERSGFPVPGTSEGHTEGAAPDHDRAMAIHICRGGYAILLVALVALEPAQVDDVTQFVALPLTR
jgi:hypothetical protein